MLHLQVEFLDHRLQTVGLLIDHVAERLCGFGELPRCCLTLQFVLELGRTSASAR
jgi:hypothetical protein